MCKRSDTERGEFPSSTNLIASNFSSNVLLRIGIISVVSNFLGSLQIYYFCPFLAFFVPVVPKFGQWGIILLTFASTKENSNF